MAVTKSRNTELAFLFLFAVCAIFVRAQFLEFKVSEFESLVQKKVEICGTVHDEPYSKNGKIIFTLKVRTYNQNEIISQPKVLVRSKEVDHKIYYGENVCASVQLTKPKVIVGDDGRRFNYPMYLAKDSIFYIGEQARVVHTYVITQSSDTKNVVGLAGIASQAEIFFISNAIKLKQKIISQIEKILPVPHSFLGAGLIISGKGSMSKELQSEFQRVGLIHIVVLSGSNVSIIGEAIIKTLSFLPLWWTTILAGFGIIFFTSMVGTSATVLRSTIMSLIGLLARVTSRENSALVSLLVAGILMLMWNPLLLFYDPSFQLSFAASLGLILYTPRVQKVVEKVVLKVMSFCSRDMHINQPTEAKLFFAKFKFISGVIEIVSSSLGTQIATLPLILHVSGLVSIIALPVNILLLPLIPYTMLFVFISSVTSFISVYVALLPGYVSWIFLEIILDTVHFFSALQFSAIQFEPLSTRNLIFLYIIISIEYLYYLYKQKQVSH